MDVSALTKNLHSEHALKMAAESLKEEEDIACDHEFISREYLSQPYGTCMTCGKTVFSDSTKQE